MNYYLYRITNLLTGKYYVGITKDYQKRLSEHRLSSSNKDLASDIEVYKWSSFESTILCIGTKEYILYLEHTFLLKYMFRDGMYNKNSGGSSNGGTYGEHHARAKLTELEVLEIRQEYAKGNSSYSYLSKLYGVTESTIGKIVRGELWSHLNTNSIIKDSATSARQGLPRDALNKDLAMQIRTLYATGDYTYKGIAKYLNNVVSHTAIGKVVRGERWKT
jgi:hypothetical protein